MSQSVHPDSPTQTHLGGVAALFDRYEVLGVIGQGGMGTVYKGYHLSLKRFVAIKVLRIDQIKSPALVGRFVREMQAIGQMDHPNVVRASDAGEKNGLFYLVMEYLEGKDLSHLVAAEGRLAPADACELIRQAAVGLDYIHHTLVHRDIKPSNLILTPSSLVKVLDLGLARLHEADIADKERTPEGCALGTFDYMAPEQASGSGRIDGRTDIYSLGCTLFKLLTGQAPFTGPGYETVARKLYAHGHVPLTALSEFGSIPEGLRAVLLRMTAKDPDERYPTAGDAARALAPFAAGSQPVRLLGKAGGAGEMTVDALPVPLPEELSRLTSAPTETRAPGSAAATAPMPTVAPAPAGRGRTWVAVALAAALLLGLGGVFFFLGWGRTGGPPPAPSPTVPAPAVDEHDLLAQAPVVLIRPSKNFQCNFDQAKREFSFVSSNLSLFQLGEASTADYGFEVVLTRNSPNDAVGLFFGFQRGPDGKQEDLGRFYAFAVRPSDPLPGKPPGAILELYPWLFNFENNNREQVQSPFSVPIPTPQGDQRIRVRVAQGKIVQLKFGAADLQDQLATLPPLKELAGGFGVYCEIGSGFVHSAKLLPPKKEP